MSGTHSRLSPSAAEAWMNCPGYPAAIDGLPNPSTEFAAEGTMAHSASDACLTLGLEPYDFIGMTMRVEGFQFTFTDEDADYLAPGIDQVRAFGGQFFGEHKVDLSEWLGPDQSGTLDRGIVLPDLIVVNDLKYGRGVPVSPVQNKQLRLYGLGFWWNVARHISKATDFLFIIDQPRCPGGGGEWRCTLDELIAFGEEARAAAAATLDPDAPRRASEKGCYWCLRREQPGGCTEYDRFNLDTIGAKFEDLDGDDELELPLLTPERRTYVLQHKKMVEQWLENLHTQAIEDAKHGRPTPGLKAVEGRRGRREWMDEEEAARRMVRLARADGDHRFTRKLISPAAAEKEIGKKGYRESLLSIVRRDDAKPILVPEADARPALTPVDEKFDEVEC
jgi:hypothetical protein